MIWRTAFKIEATKFAVFRIFRFIDIPFSEIDRIEWKSFPEDSFLYLSGGKRIRLKVSQLNKESFTNLKVALNVRIFILD
jgi:hypothetical protein